MNWLKKFSFNIHSKSVQFFLIAIVLFWIKTYVTYRIEFNLGIDNSVQEFLLFINPLSSAFLFFGAALFFKKHWGAALIAIQFILSFWLYANVVYYRFFDDFITWPTVLQLKVNGGQTESALSLMTPLDILYFTDTIILLSLLGFKVIQLKAASTRKLAIIPMAVAVGIFMFNLSLAEADRPELLTRSFDRNYLVKYLGAYNFTIYDGIQTARSSMQRTLASSDDVTEIENNLKANFSKPNSDYFGKAEGMNVMYISLESLQTFIIDYELDGQEVTPFLNSLAHDGNTFYFDNFFHQTGQGKTSDAEFMMDTSLFPLSQGSVFINKAQNTYHAAPAILKSKGYTSAALHGNYKTFWNRNEFYKALGYDHFFDATYYNMTAENVKNYGLKDKPFLEESMPLLESLPQPFYSKLLLLSNHFPFAMDEGDTDFPAGDFGDKVVNQYFQSANYMDQALEEFFENLKEAGLYDNTIIVMYGDHYGISENHNDAMEKVTGEEVTSFKNAELQRVPLFVHVPGVQGGVVHKYSGQVDVQPTILHLLGIDTRNYLNIGNDILSPEFKEIVPFRNGDFVTPEVTQVNGVCYATDTGEPIEDEQCRADDQIAKEKLEISDRIVTKDLLRFYQPDGFVPIDPNDYQYTNGTKD
ncbi:LTA synthase family protein [Lederbergia galactosidilytica]|uniref:Glycerol phosphate lipoteichoic acid synthase n=1 Tax=Lederbergia galactosidilytica TaxID=217031 RepID=A0A178A120_9BACI|nr:LTA synthase family protein [Lederbergia galactosidilytica]OAK73876.1 glycerol phosphate lipoteichoic acid synthase [Lederbergia galactosidilytica]